MEVCRCLQLISKTAQEYQLVLHFTVICLSTCAPIASPQASVMSAAVCSYWNGNLLGMFARTASHLLLLQQLQQQLQMRKGLSNGDGAGEEADQSCEASCTMSQYVLFFFFFFFCEAAQIFLSLFFFYWQVHLSQLMLFCLQWLFTLKIEYVAVSRCCW